MPPPSTKKDPSKKQGSRLGGWLFGKLKSKNEKKLPNDDSDGKPSIVMDKENEKWVNVDSTEEENKPVADPPKDSDIFKTPTATSRNRIKMDVAGSNFSVTPDKESFYLSQNQIRLEGVIVSSPIWEVKKGVCTLRGGRKIPVAVKTLKNDDDSRQEEIMKEADIMNQLANPYLVRLIGICKAESTMLVVQLLSSEPLKIYLRRRNRETPLWNVCELMWQVAEGMDFISSKKFVHRGLGARNILLSNPHTAKISNCSSAESFNNAENCYEAKKAGAWPLKWLAPENVYYWKFDSASDVWSYGVTLWEATSYGEKPYRGMKGQEVLEFVESNNRLAKPGRCPEDVYHIMMECWEYYPKERPSFSEIALKMEYQYRSLKQDDI